MYQVSLINEGSETIINLVSINIEAPRISGQIKQEVNCINSFSFTILPNNPGYNSMYPLKTMVKILNTKTNKVEFIGRILLPNSQMDSSGKLFKSVICESELGYLMDSTQKYGEYHNITVRDFLQVIIDNHNSKVSEDKHFVVGNVNVTDNNDSLYRYLDYGKTLDVIKDKLIDRLGGELIIRYENRIRYLDYLQSIGEKKETEIRLSKNLVSVEQEKDPTHIISRVTPLGEKLEGSEGRLNIASVNNGVEYIDDEVAISEFGIIEDSITWDDVNLPENLLRKAQEYLELNNKIKKKYKIDALDLSIIGLDINSFEIGNTYRVINPLMGIDEDLRVLEKTIDINSPQNSTLTVGDKFEDIKTYQLGINKVDQKVIAANSVLSSTVKTVKAVNSELSNTVGVLQNTIDVVQGTVDIVKSNSSDIEVLKNTVIDKPFIFDISNKSMEVYKSEKTLASGVVIQSFDIDFDNNCIYYVQATDKPTGELTLTKYDLTTDQLLGSMVLKEFGHGSNMCIEKNGFNTYIWIECNGLLEGEQQNGTKICRFLFEDGTTKITSAGQVFDLVPGHIKLCPDIDILRNVLAIRSKSGSKMYYSLYKLDSVLSGDPVLIKQFPIPLGVNVFPNQGFDVFKNVIYNYEGVGESISANTPSRIILTAMNFLGDVIYQKEIQDYPDLLYREPEGVKLYQKSVNSYEMFIGIASGTVNNRKVNIFKYNEVLT